MYRKVINMDEKLLASIARELDNMREFPAVKNFVESLLPVLPDYQRYARFENSIFFHVLQTQESIADAKQWFTNHYEERSIAMALPGGIVAEVKGIDITARLTLYEVGTCIQTFRVYISDIYVCPIIHNKKLFIERGFIDFNLCSIQNPSNLFEEYYYKPK